MRRSKPLREGSTAACAASLPDPYSLSLPPTLTNSKSDRLDWMYQGGLGQRQEADERHAAQEASVVAAAAAAAAPAPAGEGAPPGGAAPASRLPAFYHEDTPASANEMWQRLHADPLFAIKQQVRRLMRGGVVGWGW